MIRLFHLCDFPNILENFLIDTQSLPGPSSTRSTMKALGTRLGFMLITFGSQINNNHLNKKVYNDARLETIN